MKHLIPDVVFDQHVIILGKTRSGKSSVMRLCVEHLLDKDKPVCIIDPKGDWWGLKSSADGKEAGYPVVIFGGEHGDVPLNPRSGAAVAELISTGNRSCIIDLGGWMPGDRTQFWIDFASTFFRTHRGRHYLAIDEVHNLCPKGKIMDPNAGKMLHWSNRLASEGLGKGISMIAASQRPQKVHNDFLTSCETLVAMRVIHAADREALKAWIDGCGDPEAGKQLLNSIAQMKRGEGWVWSPEAEFGPKQIQFPLFSTYDSFKPQRSEIPAKLKGWADVDLAEVTKKLEVVVKEAEAKDPGKLQARIRELEKQLRETSGKAPSNEGAKQVDAKAVARAVEAARREHAASLSKARNRIVSLGRAPVMQFAEIYDGMIASIDLEFEALKNVSGAEVQRKESSEHSGPSTDRNSRPFERAANRPNNIQIQSNGDGELTGPEKRILFALGQLASIGKDRPPKNMVAAWSEYSPVGGAFGNPIGALRSKGLIDYPEPGKVMLTDDGREAVGPCDPPDRDEIIRRIESICTGPERKILAVVLENPSDEIPKDQLAERSGYSPIGGAFGNPVGALRTKGLIDYPRPGVVRAAQWLEESL